MLTNLPVLLTLTNLPDCSGAGNLVIWRGLMEIDAQVLAAKFQALLPHLDEQAVGRCWARRRAGRGTAGSSW